MFLSDIVEDYTFYHHKSPRPFRPHAPFIATEYNIPLIMITHPVAILSVPVTTNGLPVELTHSYLYPRMSPNLIPHADK